MDKVWMWPQTDINSSSVSQNIDLLAEIEAYFSTLYAPYKVVYFSRARVALVAISTVCELSRPQLTFVQPFSSHCVLSAVAYQSTPTTIFPQQSNQQVIYHQWGEKIQVDPQTYQNVLIEDAVDSLILSNEHSELFPNNAPFCVISLPKIMPVSIGSIVVCQKEGDYQKLIKQRAAMEQDIGDVMLTMNIPAFKEPILQVTPTLVPVLDKGIATLIADASIKIQSNIASVDSMLTQLGLPLENSANAIDSVSLTKRLPSNIAISTAKISEQSLYSQVPFNVIEQQRTYFNYQQQNCEKVWLLPCHCQANWSKE